jgi:hypothetical protein
VPDQPLPDGVRPEGLLATLGNEAARLGVSRELLLQAFPPSAAETFVAYLATIPSGIGETKLRRLLGVWDDEGDSPSSSDAPTLRQMAQAISEMRRVVGDDPVPGGGDYIFAVASPGSLAEYLERMRGLPDGVGWTALVRTLGADGDRPEDAPLADSGDLPGGNPAAGGA